jgi:choline dehydrogenase-like flavoprotein
MGADPSCGVVDRHGEMWGTHGLFVAGTAVLPTSGFANPTLTAVALAFRLAEHLVRRQKTAANSSYNSVPR